MKDVEEGVRERGARMQKVSGGGAQESGFSFWDPAEKAKCVFSSVGVNFYVGWNEGCKRKREMVKYFQELSDLIFNYIYIFIFREYFLNFIICNFIEALYVIVKFYESN